MAGGHTLSGHSHPFKINETHDAAVLVEVGRLKCFSKGTCCVHTDATVLAAGQ